MEPGTASTQPPRRISLRQIEGFLLAAEHLSFSRAAAQMDVTQSAFSQLVRELEHQLGVVLFDRTTRRVMLTAAGEAMKQKMKRGLDIIDDASEEARAIGRADRGHIRVGSLSSLAIGVVMRTLGRLRTDFPGITVSLQEGDNDFLMELIASGAVDLAVCSQVGAARELEFEHLMDDELMLVTPSASPLARRGPVRWADLADQPLVFTRRGTSTRDQADAALRRHGIVKTVDFEVATMVTSLSMVKAGFGSAFISGTGLHELDTRGVKVLRMVDPAMRRIGLYRRTDRLASPAAVQFARLLQVQAAQTVRQIEQAAWKL